MMPSPMKPSFSFCAVVQLELDSKNIEEEDMDDLEERKEGGDEARKIFEKIKVVDFSILE